MEKLDLLLTVYGIVKCCQHYGKQCGIPPPKKIKLPYDLIIPLLGFIQKTERRVLKGYLHTHFHSSISHGSQEAEAIQMPIDGWMGKQKVVFIYIKWNIIQP